MFNLDQAMANWRRHMVAVGLKSIATLDELEGHLRDGVEAQVRSGVDTKDAFESAVRRLGSPAQLSDEFAKSGPSKPAPRRIVLWCFYFFCATVAILANVWVLISFELSLGQRLGAACGLGMFSLYLFGLPRLLRQRSSTSWGYFARIMKALGIVVPLWCLFALLTALRIVHWQASIVGEMTMWSLCAAYGLTALAGVLNQSAGGHDPFGPEPYLPVGGMARPRSGDFTPMARRALDVAREEALNLGHNYVGTEHVLLGLLKTAEAALAPMLRGNGVNSEAVRGEIARLISALPIRPNSNATPLTPRARKALRLASREANALEHLSIGSEHILLGLLLEGSGVAAIVLANLGIRVDRLRSEILRR